MLVRVDPDTKRIAVLSVPRDLKVKIPGDGSDKINVAYEIGGPRKTVATIKRLFRDATGEDFPINNVDQRQLRGLPAGGQLRRRGLRRRRPPLLQRQHHRRAGESYATIDMQPGYQKLKGQDALDYVRYRHGDNDFFRASRQQDFLRQITPPGRRAQAARRQQAQASWPGSSAATSRSTSPSCRSRTSSGWPRRACSWSAEGAGQRGPLPGHRGEQPGDRHLPLHQGPGLEKTYDEFMTGEGSATPRPRRHADQGRQGVHQAQAQAQQAVVDPGLEQARVEGENMAVLAETQGTSASRSTSRRCARPARATPTTEPRLYTIKDEQRQVPPGVPARALRRRIRRVLRRPGDDLARPADPRRPRRLAHGGRPQAPPLLRRLAPAAGRLADPAGRLLGDQHALPVDPERAA